MSTLERITDWEARASHAHYQSAKLANEAGVCLRHLRRHFLRLFHRTPHQWLQELRMQQAVVMLTRNLSVKQTAFELDFKSVHHFCRAFKQTYRKTPGQWCRIGKGIKTACWTYANVESVKCPFQSKECPILAIIASGHKPANRLHSRSKKKQAAGN